MEKRVIVIVGPTCSGKTSLSLKLAEKLNTQIISADSRQIYKQLTIGTAKPSSDELKNTPHHFIDFLRPDEDYNASKFENDALGIVDELHQQNLIPIAVGGSGLYVKALVDGIFNSVDRDDEYREELLEKRKKFGNEYLYEMLQKVDPQSAAEMLPQNWKRIIRALEVFHLSGKPIWELQKEYKRSDQNIFLQFGLDWDRKKLYENIETRVDKMIEEGLVEETKSILNKGYAEELNSLNTVGYKEIISYLKNEITLNRAIELIKRNTRRFAKRQLTWFRKDDRIKWFEIEDSEEINSIAENICSNL